MATTYMNLTLPTVSVTAGPLWATELNTAFTSVDSHNHTSGQGALVPIAGLSINADLAMGGFNVSGVRSIICNSQSAALALGSDINSYYSKSGLPYFNDNSGTAQQLLSVLPTFAVGDMLYASSTTVVSKLSIGTTGQSLKVNAGLPSWQSSGSTLAIVTKTNTNYTLTPTDDVVLFSAGASNRTALLPSVAANAGKVFYIKKIDSGVGTVIVDGANSETIDGATTDTLSVQYEAVTIVSDGSTWWIL